MNLLINDLSSFCKYFSLSGFAKVRIIFLRYFYVIILIRLQSQRAKILIPIKFISKALLSLIYNIEVASNCSIGSGLILPHPQNIIIGSYSIGENCMIMANVTIGAKYPDPKFNKSKRPKIGNDVLIGAGACILGGVVIGDSCKIGANAVITKSCPKKYTIVGFNKTIINSE